MDLASLFASMGAPPPSPSTCETTGPNYNWLIIIIALAIILFFRKDSFGISPYAGYPDTSCCRTKHHKHHHHYKHEDTYMPPFTPVNGLQNNILPIILIGLLLILILQKKRPAAAVTPV